MRPNYFLVVLIVSPFVSVHFGKPAYPITACLAFGSFCALFIHLAERYGKSSRDGSGDAGDGGFSLWGDGGHHGHDCSSHGDGGGHGGGDVGGGDGGGGGGD